MTPRPRAAPGLLAALIVAVLAMATLLAGPLRAQNPFSPVIFVNDSAITRYELDQRAQMLTLFRAPGDPRELAREQLVEERVKLEAARSAGISVSEEGLQAGMEEFAARGNMDVAQMTDALAQSGVSEQSFRDFVRAGITWRELTRARFAGRVSVSEDEIDRATRALSGSSPVRVLLSEIILPVRSAEEAEARQRLAARIAAAESEAEFAAFAREHSAAPTAGQGGRLGWQAVSELPRALRQIALGLAPGEVSDPLPIEGGPALVYLRIRDLHHPRRARRGGAGARRPAARPGRYLRRPLRRGPWQAARTPEPRQPGAGGDPRRSRRPAVAPRCRRERGDDRPRWPDHGPSHAVRADPGARRRSALDR